MHAHTRKWACMIDCYPCMHASPHTRPMHETECAVHVPCMGARSPCVDCMGDAWEHAHTTPHACTHPMHAKCDFHAKPRMHTSAPGCQTLDSYMTCHIPAWAKNSGRGEVSQSRHLTQNAWNGRLTSFGSCLEAASDPHNLRDSAWPPRGACAYMWPTSHPL